MKNCTRLILQQLLDINNSNQILLLFDLYGLNVAIRFIKEGLNLDPTVINARLIPYEYQKYFDQNKPIPNSLIKTLEESEGLIFVVTDKNNCTGFRIKVIEYAQEVNCRILHMPGVNDEIFKKACSNTDLIDIERKARPIYKMLHRKKEVVINTRDNKGQIHTLKMSIYNRIPRICGDKIGLGEIMNFPTGEVYIAPNEYSTEGSIVINGSSEYSVFRENEVNILKFKNGKLDLNNSQFSTRTNSTRFFKQLKKELPKNKINSIVGELGIGLNKQIKKLTGNEVQDEKMFGTAHIALGSNKIFGGKLKGNFHKDIIFYPESIIIDNEVLDHEWGKTN